MWADIYKKQQEPKLMPRIDAQAARIEQEREERAAERKRRKAEKV
jgi:hypothetical protein